MIGPNFDDYGRMQGLSKWNFFLNYFLFFFLFLKWELGVDFFGVDWACGENCDGSGGVWSLRSTWLGFLALWGCFWRKCLYDGLSLDIFFVYFRFSYAYIWEWGEWF